MTRITNFGRKRTYLKAGFGNDADNEKGGNQAVEEPPSLNSDPAERPKKRKKKSKAVVDKDVEGNGASLKEEVQAEDNSEKNSVGKSKRAKSGVRKERMHNQHDRAVSSERRRLNRIVNRHADMTCLRCRQKGHSVKECPETASKAVSNANGEEASRDSKAKTNASPGVGICYRCGSRRHNLYRCKKPADPQNPLPFASCFVCSKSGHLASTCPQNAGKGIYPNGGCCKICKQTSHLAKDCPLKSREMAAKDAVLLGDARAEGGADEDDFHVIKRRRDAVQKEETVLKTSNDKGDVPKKVKSKVVVFT